MVSLPLSDVILFMSGLTRVSLFLPVRRSNTWPYPQVLKCRPLHEDRDNSENRNKVLIIIMTAFVNDRRIIIENDNASQVKIEKNIGVVLRIMRLRLIGWQHKIILIRNNQNFTQRSSHSIDNHRISVLFTNGRCKQCWCLSTY